MEITVRRIEPHSANESARLYVTSNIALWYSELNTVGKKRILF